MAAAAAGLPPETLTAVAADGAAGLAPQFAAQPASSSPPPGLRGGSGGGGGHLPVLLPLEALVYHPTDSVMKPIVGNKRWVGDEHGGRLGGWQARMACPDVLRWRLAHALLPHHAA